MIISEYRPPTGTYIHVCHFCTTSCYVYIPLHLFVFGIKFRRSNAGHGRTRGAFDQLLHSKDCFILVPQRRQCAADNLGHLSSHDLGLGAFLVLPLLGRVALHTCNPRTQANLTTAIIQLDCRGGTSRVFGKLCCPLPKSGTKKTGF